MGITVFQENVPFDICWQPRHCVLLMSPYQILPEWQFTHIAHCAKCRKQFHALHRPGLSSGRHHQIDCSCAICDDFRKNTGRNLDNVCNFAHWNILVQPNVMRLSTLPTIDQIGLQLFRQDSTLFIGIYQRPRNTAISLIIPESEYGTVRQYNMMWRYIKLEFKQYHTVLSVYAIAVRRKTVKGSRSPLSSPQT